MGAASVLELVFNEYILHVATYPRSKSLETALLVLV